MPKVIKKKTQFKKITNTCFYYNIFNIFIKIFCVLLFKQLTKLQKSLILDIR